MTKQEQEAIASLDGALGMVVLRKIVKEQMEELKDINNIKVDKSKNVEAEVIGNQQSYKFCKKLMETLTLSNVIPVIQDRTYE